MLFSKLLHEVLSMKMRYPGCLVGVLMDHSWQVIWKTALGSIWVYTMCLDQMHKTLKVFWPKMTGIKDDDYQPG